MPQNHCLDVRTLINTLPLSRYQKLIVFLGFCVIALDGFDIAIMGFIAPSLQQEWGVAHYELGFIISAALVGLALGAMLSGPLADRLGRKKIIVNSVFFFGFWTIATAFSQNVEQMVFFRFMTGLGLGAAMPNISTLVSEYAPERRRSFLITLIFCGFTFGAAVGGFTASWLIPRYGWHSLMALGGILPLLFAPVLIIWLPESVRFLVIKGAPAARIRRILQRLYPGQIAADAQFAMPEPTVVKSAVGIVLSREYRFGTLMLWVVYFMGLSVSEAAVMTALYQAGGTLGSLFAGWLMDRVNPDRALGLIYTVGGVFTVALGFASGSFIGICLVAFVSGGCLSGANTGMNALSARFYPTQARATGSSWMHGVGRLGAILSAFAGAEMIALNLSFSAVFLLLGIPAAIAVVALLAKSAVQGRRGAGAACPVRLAAEKSSS